MSNKNDFSFFYYPDNSMINVKNRYLIFESGGPSTLVLNTKLVDSFTYVAAYVEKDDEYVLKSDADTKYALKSSVPTDYVSNSSLTTKLNSYATTSALNTANQKITNLTNRISTLETENTQLKAKVAAFESKSFEISPSKIMQSYNAYPTCSPGECMAKYINYVEGSPTYCNFEFKEKTYPNAKYMFIYWFNEYYKFTATIEFDFKTNTGTIKSPEANINSTIQGKNSAGYFQIEGILKGNNNDFNLINDYFEEPCYAYIKQFVLIEDNIGDETASTSAGIIKMLT